MNREIEEGNKVIVEFMGWKKSPYTNTPNKVYKDNESIHVDQLKYNSSWDWLMPVVEKIEKHGCIVEIWLSGGKGCRITKVLSKTKSWTAPVESNSTIEAVYTAVVEFIKYHNSLTPPTNE